MKGLVIINAYPNGEKFIRQGKRIADELNLLGVPTALVKNGDIYAAVRKEGEPFFSYEGADFAVYLDKDKYLGRLLEGKGLRLFNRAAAVELCDDKMSTYCALLNSGLRLCESIPAPLCYTPNAKSSGEFLKKVGDSLGFPLVAKKSYGSFGNGVQLVHGYAELLALEEEWLHIPHFYQRYIAESAGRDIRVLVIGGEAVAAMQRVAQKGEFRSNVELGGRGEKIDLPKEYAQAAERAAKTLGLDYCGVDLLESADGAVICEVNSNAFFEGLEETTGVNIPRLYANYVVKSVKNDKK